MFSRLDKFDGPIFEGAYVREAYIRDVNWVTYLGSVYSGGGGRGVDLYKGGVLTGFYGISCALLKCVLLKLHIKVITPCKK